MAALPNPTTVDTLPSSSATPIASNSSTAPQSKHASFQSPPNQGTNTTAAPRSSSERTFDNAHARRSYHASSSSTNSINRTTSTRTAGGILSRAAAAALDRTQTVIASISDSIAITSSSDNHPVLRHRQSNSGLDSEPSSPSRSATSSYHSTSSRTGSKASPNSSATSSVDRSQSYPEPEYKARRPENKMHQTSSRLLRMTDDDRPFTRVSHAHTGGRPAIPCLHTTANMTCLRISKISSPH